MRLTMKERKVITKALSEQYRKATKKQKGPILDQVVESTGYTRCYARFVLRNHGRRVEVQPGIVLEGDRRVSRRRRRTPRYGPAVVEALRKIWKILDCICGKRLVGALPEVVPRLVAFKEIRIPKAVQRQLLDLSAATIDRLLKPERVRYTLKARGRTKPGTLLKHQVPVRTFSDWNDTQPGFFEMDLVGHDAGIGAGDYCQTLDMTDVATGWSEQAAVLNKAEKWVFEGIQTIRHRLPFPLRGLDSDNGGEFINHHLVRYCRAEHITFTRSRPYRKNDTCYVEQKNWSIVRRFVGYPRYESQAACDGLNELYNVLREYNNFFLPSQKLKEKIRDGAHVMRRHDRAKTPYARVLESPHIDPAVKRRLSAYYQTLNPAALHRRIQTIQKKLATLAAPRPIPRPHPKIEFTAFVPKRTGKTNGGGNAHPRRSSRPLGRRSGRTPALPYPPPRSPRSYTRSKARSRTKTRSALE
jgi:hypothetical protein